MATPPPPSTIRPFDRPRTIGYFLHHLNQLPEEYLGAETNRLTLCYFCVSALDILDALDQLKNKQGIIDWIYNLQVCPPENDKDLYWQHAGFIGGTFLGGTYLFGENVINENGNINDDGDTYRISTDTAAALKKNVRTSYQTTTTSGEYIHGHLAMTYTAIVSLLILGDDLSRLKKEPIVRALSRLF